MLLYIEERNIKRERIGNNRGNMRKYEKEDFLKCIRQQNQLPKSSVTRLIQA